MTKNPYYYIGANPTADIIVINPEQKILLIRRAENSPACAGMWALPGGFVNTDALNNSNWEAGLETPEEAALRELAEETNLILTKEIESFSVGIYTGNHRDPRDNEISWSEAHAFLYKIDNELFEAQKNTIIAGDDADGILWATWEEIQQIEEMAFDHKKIIEDAVKLYLSPSNIKPSF